MQARSLGKVSVPSAGTPRQVVTDGGLVVARIRIQAVQANTGKVFIGVAGMDKTTFAGCIAEFAIPGSDQPSAFEVASEDGTNALRLADYFVDAAVNGEGVIVSYWIR